MKNLLLASICSFYTVAVAAQNVGIGSSTFTPNASALLELRSTTSGFLVPRMNTSQVSAIAAPAEGLLVYQTNATKGFKYYDGTAWKQFGEDNLGSHAASQNLKLNGFWLSNDGGNEGIMISNDGKVGIGASNPNAKLEVAGNARITDLSGSGTRMVVATAHGDLATQDIPNAGIPVSRSASSNKSISSASYSNGNSVISDLTLSDLPAGDYLVQYNVVFTGTSGGAFIVEAGGSQVAVSEREIDSGIVQGMAVVTLNTTGDIVLRARKTGGGAGLTLTNRTMTAVRTN